MAERLPQNPLSFKAGETILQPSASVPPHRVYRVISGFARILCTDDEGDVLVLRHVAPGGYFGEESLTTGNRHYYVEAVVPTRILPVDARKLNAVEARELAAYLIGAVDQIHTAIKRISSQRLRNRLAAALIELAESPLAQRDSRGQIIIRVTHDELAAIIGSVRETATKAIGELVRLGLVKSGYGRLRLLNLDELRRMAVEYE